MSPCVVIIPYLTLRPSQREVSHSLGTKVYRMNQHIITDGVVEVAQLARTHSVDGIEVSVRCFWVAQPKPHYELRLTGREECGIVDVPLRKEHVLDDEMEEAAVCFATSLRLRQNSWS